MEKKKFEIILQTISTGLIEKNINETGSEENAAMEKLYSSALYSALETEKTKMWHYSIPMLYDLYNEEIKTGKFAYPEH